MFYRFLKKIYSFFNKSFEKPHKKCYLCKNYIDKYQELYFAMDNIYCSENCREYHISYNYI